MVNTERSLVKSVVRDPRVCSGKHDRLVELVTFSSSLVSVGRRCGWTFLYSSFAVKQSVSLSAF